MSGARAIGWVVIWFAVMAPLATARTIAFIPAQTTANGLSAPPEVALRDADREGYIGLTAHNSANTTAMFLGAYGGMIDAPTSYPRFLRSWWHYRRGEVQHQPKVDWSHLASQRWRMRSSLR